MPSFLSTSPPPQHTGRRALWALLASMAVVAPWINPVSSGPMPNAIPWMVSAACALVLVGAYCAWAGSASADQLRRTPDYLFVAWLCAALASSVFALAQYLGKSAALSPWVDYAAAGEAFGNLRQRNQFASLTAIGLVSAVYLGTVPAWSARNHWLRWAWVGAAVTLLAMANAASASRTGALQWVVVATLACLWSRSNQRQGAVLACCALLAYFSAIVLMPTLLHMATGLTNQGLLGRLREPSGCESRRVLWANVGDLIAERPITGWGWGELKFAHFTHHYAGERFCAILDNAHNLPLHLAVELGIPIATALCTALAWLVWRGHPWSESDKTRQSAWAVLAIVGLHSLLEYPLWYGPFQIAVGLCVWLLCRPRQPEIVATRMHGGAAAVRHMALGLGVLALTYCAWDYARISQLYRAPDQRLAMFSTDTLEKARRSLIFAHAVQFAELTTTPLNDGTAARLCAMAQRLLHFSPEPTVLKILLDSAAVVGVDNANLRHVQDQFSQAYPQEYARWLERRAMLQRLQNGQKP